MNRQSSRLIVALMLIMPVIVVKSFAQVSQTPPMGFNSYDCLNFSATETEMKAIADTMAKKYLKYGWQYVSIDWCWSFPGMGSNNGQNWINNVDGNPTADTRLNMDAYGRLMPDTVRHPSSKGGKGFKPLADYIHSKGLKFGIHIMRGIPRQAVYANTPIFGTSYHAADAANKNENCAWLDQMYGLNFNSPAARAYLASIINMYAEWGIDIIKIDDLMNSNVNPRTTFKTYIQTYREMIDSTHRPIVFSTSPGATPVGDSVFMRTYANQWRMADDLWDNWGSLNNMIGLFASWYRNAYAPHFPDADMIPIGRLSKRGPVGAERWSGLTRAQQYTMMTMWIIGRSPLLWGGDVRDNRPEEDSLMTNPEVIAVNQLGANPRPLSNTSNSVIWVSDRPDSANIKYLALVNRTNATATLTATLTSLGLGTISVRNLWTRTNLPGTYTTTFSQSIGAYSSGLYKLTDSSMVSVAPTFAAPMTMIHPAAKTFSVVGNRCVLPEHFAGKKTQIRVFDPSGRQINSIKTNGEAVVSLNKGIAPTSQSIFIVQIKLVE